MHSGHLRWRIFRYCHKACDFIAWLQWLELQSILLSVRCLQSRLTFVWSITGHWVWMFECWPFVLYVMVIMEMCIDVLLSLINGERNILLIIWWKHGNFLRCKFIKLTTSFFWYFIKVNISWVRRIILKILSGMKSMCENILLNSCFIELKFYHLFCHCYRFLQALCSWRVPEWNRSGQLSVVSSRILKYSC